MSSPGIDIGPANDPSITSGITFDADTDGEDSLLGVASLDFDPESEYVSLLGKYISL